MMKSMRHFRPVVLSGPSGGGKSTLLKKLMEKHKDCFAFSVSHTTRAPRSGESTGKEYHFVSRDQMESAIKKGDFLEHAEFSGNLYGTTRQAVQEVGATGRICILDIDMQGVLNVKKIPELNARFVFIRPPTFDVLEQRLRARGTETEESILKRLTKANEELEFGKQKGIFDLVLLNDDLDRAYNELEGFLSEDIFKVKNSRFGSFGRCY